MRVPRIAIVGATLVTLIGATLLTSRQSFAQRSGRLPKSIYIQAQAMGTSYQLGRQVSVNLIIQEYSTTDDQQALFGAFTEKGNEGLVNALSKMKGKGRMQITGTLGYEVTYIKKFDMPDGSTKIRMITDRPLRFGEAWSDTRSSDYNLSAAEIILSPNEKKNSGSLLPACKFKINKKKELEIELLQNPWKLVNVRRR